MGEKPVFNLIYEPWIPVINDNSSTNLVGLQELFCRAKNIRDISVRPEERIALMRLFMALAYASRREDGWSDSDGWKSLEADIAKYLVTWQDYFWLHHAKHPFLQIPNLSFGGNKKERLTSLCKLNIALASGNNPQLYDHGEVRMSSAEIARALLAFQCLSPGGLVSVVSWGGILTSKSSVDAPCIPQGMLHAFLRGKSFSETLRLNLVSPQYLQNLYSQQLQGEVIGRPIWEKFPKNLKDTLAVKNATRTFVGRLVPLSRAVLIRDEGMLYGEALRYPNFSNPKDTFPAEPSATVVTVMRKSKQEEKLLSFSPEKSVWRQIPSFFVWDTGRKERGPLTLRQLRSQPADYEYDIVVDGVARSDASILESQEFVYPVRPKMLTEVGLLDYNKGLEIATSWERRLASAVDSFRTCFDTKWQKKVSDAGAGRSGLLNKLRSTAFLFFWTEAERNIQLLFAAANAKTDEQAKENLDCWARVIRDAAFQAYKTVGGFASARNIQAFVLGEQKLRFHRTEVIKNER